MIVKKILLPILFIFPALLMLSCAPQPNFGSICVCSSIDEQTFQPHAEAREYEIDAGEIYATIQAEDVLSSDKWKYRWVDVLKGTVLAESSGRYMEADNLLVSGFFASSIVASPDSGIIALPGDYRVEYYHNQELVDSQRFTIKKPELMILEAVLSSEASQKGCPSDPKNKFLIGEDIFLCLETNCLLEGSRLETAWFRGDRKIEEAEIVLKQSVYSRSYLAFSLEESIIPPGQYRVEAYVDHMLADDLEFEVTVDRRSTQKYENQEYNFTLYYPEWMEAEEQDTEKSLRVFFTPQSFEAGIALGALAAQADYAPGDEEWSAFAQEVLLEDIEQEYGLELKEEQEEEGMLICYYQDQEGSEWELILSFEDESGGFYVFMGLADSYYAADMEGIYADMLDSLQFEIE